MHEFELAPVLPVAGLDGTRLSGIRLAGIRLAGFFIPILFAVLPATASAQQPASAPVRKSCSVVRTIVNSPADQALADQHYAEAEQLFSAMPPSSMATVGVERAMLGQGKYKEALALATKESAAHPDDALLLDGLGEVRFRRGEVVEAAAALNKSNALDPCAARTSYDMYRYLLLEGRAHTAQVELDLAHRLAPGDEMIAHTAEISHRVPATPEQTIAHLQQQMQDVPSEEAKSELADRIKQVQAFGRGGCELVSKAETVKLPMAYMGNAATVQGSGKIGLDMQMNGKRKRLELDTGASGLLITRAAAASLGLAAEAETRVGGIGDVGAASSYVTHVDSIKLGNMEFHHCRVEVFEGKNVLPGQDGLVGADIFDSFLVTLDFPSMELRLGPLPKRPGEAEATLSLGTNGAASGGKALAETRQDRYIAPEMKNWTPVFRSGHNIIFPTYIGNVPEKLFIMDTGSFTTLISPEAAREVTQVGRDDSFTIKGLSGTVNNVSTTGALDLTFGKVKVRSTGLVAIDTSAMSRDAGVQIAGLLGMPILRQLKLEIDYRDDLVNVTYVPHIDPRDYK